MTRKSEPRTVLLTAPEELDGVRLDKLLAQLLGDTPRTRIREMVEDGRVRVGEEVVRRPAWPVTAGATLRVELTERDRSRAGGAPGLSFSVLLEDEHLVVIDKPAGLVAHPSTTVRGGTVSEQAAARFGPLPGVQGEDRPGIVHRLDRDTSGAMVIARTEEAGQGLVEAFRRREVEKEYLALVHGDPRFDSDWITAPIARSERTKDRMAVVEAGEGQAAETFYTVLERFGELALLACTPRTGRTHQLRVHLAHIGHTVVGDTVYRMRRKLALPGGFPAPRRHLLHARRLAFTHPVSGARVDVEAPLPADFADALEYLRAR
jgi:23S rRNA pseudouridine1911/1915/1917 synthase